MGQEGRWRFKRGESAACHPLQQACALEAQLAGIHVHKAIPAGGAEALEQGAHVSKAGLGPQLHPGLQHQVPKDIRWQALLHLANHHSLHQATLMSAGPGAVHGPRD